MTTRISALCRIVLMASLGGPMGFWGANPQQPGGNGGGPMIARAGDVLKEVFKVPDDIPQGILDRADCVVVIPRGLRISFAVGGDYGRGVMTCRSGDDFHGSWGPPILITLGGSIVGLQLGGEENDFVLLIMNSHSTNFILRGKVKLGGDVSMAAGPGARDGEGDTDGFLRADVLVYSRDRRGLVAGVSSLRGGTLGPDNEGNGLLYGRDVPAEAIVLRHAVEAPQEADVLLALLKKHSPKRRPN